MIGLTWTTAPLVLLGSYAIGWLSTRMGVWFALRRLRGADGAPWFERARLAYPARLLAGKNLAIVPFAVGAIVGSQVAPRLGLPVVPFTILAGLAALVACTREVLSLERRIYRPAEVELRQSRGIPVMFVLILPGLITFGLTVAAMPTQWGRPAGLVTVAGLVAIVFQILAVWLIPLRRMGLIRPASARLTSIVDQASAQMGVPHRGVLELVSPDANAIAWPVPRLIIFTGPIAGLLDDAELAAVASHELGHLNESWGVYLVRIFSALFLVVLPTAVPLTVTFGPLLGMAPLLGLLVMVLVGQRVGRRMEERSDRLGREHEGDDAGTYARALAKIYEANLIPVVMKPRRDVHPDLYDRMIAAGVVPNYPRPVPPPGVGPAILPIYLLIIVAVLSVLNGSGLASSLRDLPDGDRDGLNPVAPGFSVVWGDGPFDATGSIRLYSDQEP